MGKISSYPSDANVTTSDRLIGSDNENANETKNYSVGAIINLASSIIGPNYVPYTGATGNVDLGVYDINADNATFTVITSPEIYVTDIFNKPSSPSIIIGSDNAQPVGLLINTSTNVFKLGDYNGNFNATGISIEDGLSRITFVGGFNLSNGQGTGGQVLTSAGAGNTPIWSSLSASYVPYIGATADVDLGVYDITATIGYFPTVYATSIHPTIGVNSIYIGDDALIPVGGLLIDRATNLFILGDVYSQFNNTRISIEDGSSRISFVGSFNLSNGEGTAGQILKSNGVGTTPSWVNAPSTSGLVPYTGATGSVNLGIYSMTAANINANNFVPILGGSGNTFFGGTGGYGVARNGVYALGTDITILGDSTPGSSTYIQIDAPNTNIAFLNGYVSLSGTSGLFLTNGFGTAGHVLISSGGGFAPLWSSAPELATNTFWKGSFYDTITQTLSAANTATPVILRNTDAPATNGVSIVTDGTNLSRITFANAGTYNILFSAQLANAGGTSQTVDFWLRKNGSTAAANISNTNGKVQLQGNVTYVMAAWNYFVTVSSGDYIQLVWAATATTVSMVTEAANALHPATPSIILTANIV